MINNPITFHGLIKNVFSGLTASLNQFLSWRLFVQIRWPVTLLICCREDFAIFVCSKSCQLRTLWLVYIRSIQRLHPTLLMTEEHVMHHQDGLWNDGVWSDLFIEPSYTDHGLSGIVGTTLNESTLAILALSHGTLGLLMKPSTQSPLTKKSGIPVSN